jgi:glycosyltransferase involved in cell wall biosynthesis
VAVTIDGVEYAPVGISSPRIGVGITTRNRRDIALETVARWRRHLPPGAVLVVVDDASDVPFPDANHRFERRAGIARAKNRCLDLLEQAGCEHLFLADDDTYPLVDDWWRPYVGSPEPHLMHVFEYRGGPQPIAHGNGLVAWPHPCGCLLYAHRSVLARVGGMDVAYGTWGHEHIDWSNRIHNAGLTVWRFADVVDSGQLIHCLDQDGTERTVDKRERDQQLRRNQALYAANIDSAAYREYRMTRDVVLTAWQHGPDRQRKNRTATISSAQAAATLRTSVTGADVVLFADDGTGDVEVTDLGLGVYLSRWVHYAHWLREHPEVRFAWCVDANDVQMQLPPWQDMQPGRLYCGWEPDVVGSPWMRDNHPAAILQEFIQANADRQLLNCGVMGGDRDTLLEFLTHWCRLIEDAAPGDLGADMGPFNYIAYTRFADRIVTGSRVTTVFKRNETNTWSWWRHK